MHDLSFLVLDISLLYILVTPPLNLSYNPILKTPISHIFPLKSLTHPAAVTQRTYPSSLAPRSCIPHLTITATGTGAPAAAEPPSPPAPAHLSQSPSVLLSRPHSLCRLVRHRVPHRRRSESAGLGSPLAL